MENIDGKHRPRWMLLCATTALAVSASLCFAQGNREAQLVGNDVAVSGGAAVCDSLDPKVCFDIYQRRMERIPAPILSDDQGDNGEWCLMVPHGQARSVWFSQATRSVWFSRATCLLVPLDAHQIAPCEANLGECR
jgi:hypothetical protein